jgi:nitrogen fixation NifU-like protein
MNIYQEKLLDHYNNPRNFGEIAKASAGVELENISCGDAIKLQLLVEDDIVKDIKFKGEGCAVAIGTASMLTEYALGKNVNDLQKFSLDDLLDLIGIELTMSRIKCAALSLESLHKAIEDCSLQPFSTNKH